MVEPPAEPGQFDHLARPFAAGADARPAAMNRRDEHVLIDRHMSEGPWDLVRPAYAGAAAVPGPHTRNVASLKGDASRIRRKHAEHEIEQRRLAGAVRAEDAEDVALGD